jgi:hypothetical protein
LLERSTSLSSPQPGLAAEASGIAGSRSLRRAGGVAVGGLGEGPAPRREAIDWQPAGSEVSVGLSRKQERVIEMVKRHEYEQAFVVLRLDRDRVREDAPADALVTAVEALPTIAEARAEVDRLNSLRTGRGSPSEYFMSTCRWYATGRDTPEE